MKRTCFVFILIIPLIFTTSCWSRREIESLGFVMGLGISKTEGGLYSVVAQVANPSSLVSENPSGKDIYTIMKSEGITVFDALRNMSTISKRRLYIAHINSVIIDESIAKDGLGEGIGFLVQDMEVRLEMNVFISKIPPKDILDTPNYLRLIPSIGLSTITKNLKANNKIYVADLHETLEAVNNPVINYVTALVEKQEPPSKNELPELKLTSIAIFDHDKLEEYLDLEEGQAYNIITNNFENGLIAFEYAITNDKIIIEVLESKTKIVPTYGAGKVSFNIEVDIKGNLTERVPKTEISKVDIELLQEQFNKVIEDKLKYAFSNAQKKYEIDYFNLSKDFFRKYPKEFKALKNDWNKVFSNADISVKVKSNIIHSALNLNRGRI